MRKLLILLCVLCLYVLGEDVVAEEDPTKKLRIVSLGGEQGKECDRNEVVQKGDKISIHYTGWVAKGESLDEKGAKFDSSVDRDQPFETYIGKGNVIKGWDRGMLGLCKGSKRRLIIPPDMGYGDQGAGGSIPGGATLIFDTQLVAISEPRKSKKKRRYGKVWPVLTEQDEETAEKEL